MNPGESRPQDVRRPAFHRRQYIVDKPFQHRLIGTLMSIWLANSLFFTIVLYFFYVGHLQRFYDLVPRAGMEPLLTLPMLFTVSMLFVYVFGFIVLGIIALYMSNQIAGPLYRTKKSMDRVGQGDFAFRLQFRQGDFLRDIPGVFNAMLDGLKQQMQATVTELKALEEAPNDPLELKRRVRELRERKESAAGLASESAKEAVEEPDRVRPTVS